MRIAMSELYSLTEQDLHIRIAAMAQASAWNLPYMWLETRMTTLVIHILSSFFELIAPLVKKFATRCEVKVMDAQLSLDGPYKRTINFIQFQ